MTTRGLVPACVTLLMACAAEPNVTSSSTVVVSLAQTFTLSPGAAAELPEAGLVLRFDRVPEDSRCPVDVDCVWEGNAIVLLNLRIGEAPAEPVELRTTLQPRGAVAGSFRIELVSLEPLPVSDRPVDPSSYRATLRVVPDER